MVGMDRGVDRMTLRGAMNVLRDRDCAQRHILERRARRKGAVQMSKSARKSARRFFLFGLAATKVAQVKRCGYWPPNYYEQNEQLREVIDFVAGGALDHGDSELFRPIAENLLNHDPFLLFADYQAYINTQARVSALWRDPNEWTCQ